MIIFPAPGVPQISNALISIDDLLLGVTLGGVKWRYTRFDGWGMGAGVDTQFAPRPGRHGTFDAPVYRRERVITIEGTIVAGSRGDAVRAEQQLAATLADGTVGTLSVDDPDLGIQSAQVRLSAAPQSDGSNKGVGIIRWSLQFTAPDWRKYAETQSVTTGLAGGVGGLAPDFGGALFDSGSLGSPGTMTVTNDGTAATEPRFTVTAPMAAGFVLSRQETGEQLVYPQPVTSDVVVDCGEGTVTSGGQDRTGLLTVDEFFSIGRGETATFQFATLGGETAASPCRARCDSSPAYA